MDYPRVLLTTAADATREGMAAGTTDDVVARSVAETAVFVQCIANWLWAALAILDADSLK